MSWRPPVRVASTANITLSGTQTIDGVAVVAGDRVLVKDQSTASQNGIYVCAAGAWSRATDADTWSELVSQVVMVSEGSTQADQLWVCTVNAGGTLGVTNVVWTALTFSLANNSLTLDKFARVGTAGQVLTSNGAGADPSYQTLSSAPRSGTKGLVGNNNGGTPNTQYDFSAAEVVLSNGAGGLVLRTATGTITNNVSTAGSTANGRDQAGAFTAGSWVHFWFIWDGATLATLSSASPTAPTLPAGYTHKAYIGAVYFNGSSQLVATRMRGARTFYKTPSNALASGTATTETSVSLSSLIPPNALSVSARLHLESLTGGSAGDTTGKLRTDTGSDFFVMQDFFTASLNVYQVTSVEIPNVSQSVYYLVSATTGSAKFTITILSYLVPNGDS
jgi:hypothetical protein